MYTHMYIYILCLLHRDRYSRDLVNLEFKSYLILYSDGQCSGAKTALNFSNWQHSGLGQDLHSSVQNLSQLPSSKVINAGRMLLGLST